MEMLWAILPFFNAGLICSVFSRFTGMNLSMCVLFAFLYMGATPIECISAMLMFNVFTYFTVYTQNHIFKMKDLTFFPGVKVAIPILLTVAFAAISPFFGITFFIFVFLMEIFAKRYKELNAKERPAKGALVKACVVSGIVIIIGAFLVQYVPANYYYIVGGIVTLYFVVLMWLAGDRRKWSDQWGQILSGTFFLTGLSGIDATDWIMSMKRNGGESVLSRCYDIIINGGTIIAVVVMYFVYHFFPIGALFATIGAAIGIRLFGLYGHSTKGKFSYVALGITVLVTLVFMILQPVPTGFPPVPGAEETGILPF